MEYSSMREAKQQSLSLFHIKLKLAYQCRGDSENFEFRESSRHITLAFSSLLLSGIHHNVCW